jgi:hypothetical protein
MNALRLDRRLLLPRPGRTLLRASFGFAIPVLIFLIFRLRRNDASLDLILIQFVVAQVAVALATGHKEILAATASYFRPGLRSQLCAAQLIATAIAGLGALAAGLLLFPHPDARALTTVFAMAVSVHAGMTLLTLHLHWSYQFTLWMFYLTPVIGRLGGLTHAGAQTEWLVHPVPWLAAAALLVTLLARRLSSRSLQRRLNGAMVLGFEDMFSTSRMRSYRELRSRNARHGQGPRWRSALLEFALARAAAARSPGREAEARAWLLAHAGAALTLCRRQRVLVLFGVLAAGLAVFGGYYDDWRSGGDKQPLYAGLVYSFAAAPLVAVCSAMNARLSSAASRRTAFRSELTALGGAFGVTIVLTGIFWVVFVVLAAQLPVLSLAGRELTYTPPSPHLNWLVPLLAPFIWLGVALRPRHASNLPASMMTMAFLIGYNTIVFYPYAGATLVVVGLAAGAGLVAFVQRRRWWQRADLAV